MIFVTVGTHEQPFNRLIEYMDNLKHNGKIEDEIFIQKGYSTYEPRCCNWSNILPYNKMEVNVADARIIITHGGPASFIMPLRIGKIPIVVPRQFKFGEHVNDHQLDFVNTVSERLGTIIPVVEIKKLGEVIENYDSIVFSMNHKMNSNNLKFNQELDKVVKLLF